MGPDETPGSDHATEAERAARAVGLGMLLGLLMSLAARLARRR